MIELIIYLVGVIIAYIMFKKIVRSRYSSDWEDVGWNIFFSLFSYIMVVMMIIEYIFRKLNEKEPPKWL